MQHSHQHGHQHGHMHVRSEGYMGSSSSRASQTMVERASRAMVARGVSTCTSDSDPGCTKPTQVPTLAIALAILVPVVGLAIVLFFLHRRHNKKLREEDVRDKYKSLDFGMEPTAGGMNRGKKGPEMTVTEKSAHDRGLSLETGSPYMLPPGLHGSRDSLHSMSRSQLDAHDPYRPVYDTQSVRSPTRGPNDNGSLYTTSSSGRDGLLQNAQSMSMSHPVRGESYSPDDTRSPDVKFPEPAVALNSLKPVYENDTEPKTQYAAFKPTDVPTISLPEAAVTNRQLTKSPVQTTPSSPAFPMRVKSQQAFVGSNANTASIISTSSYGDGFQVTPPSPRQSEVAKGPLSPKPQSPQGQQNVGLGVDGPAPSKRLSMSLRPLPPSDESEENPEQRAMRIRSFYKEYFDDSKPEPAGGHAYTNHVEDYASEYQDGTVFDPVNGNFVVAQPNAPFAEPITRRAMTPPPRAPPRFRSNSGPRGPHMSGSSMASSQYPPPRGMSSMSGQLAAPVAKKPLPPPSALSSLPTPAKLSENSMVFDPIDFAPPVSYRDRQNGARPDSPLGSPRPYSPAVRPHTPLVGAYDDLAVLPSPHLLRKSGNFTALDFAPPGRIRDPASNAGSDAGSIRSNRSGMTAAGRMAVRTGANRVSRIPKGVVTTKDDLMVQLRPTMDMGRNT